MILAGVRCPGCGAEELEVRQSKLVCGRLRCPRPDAAQRILTEAATAHVVQINEADYSLEHPLIERLDGILFDACPLEEWMHTLSGPPVSPGRYNVRKQANPHGFPWAFERIPYSGDDGGRIPHAPDAATVAADAEG